MVINKNRKISLKFFIILFYSLLFAFSFVAFGIFFSILSKNITYKDIISEAKHILDMSVKNVDLYLEHIINITDIVSRNDLIVSYVLNENEISDWKVGIFLKDVSKYNPKIKDIMLIDKTGFPIIFSGSYGVKFDYNFYSSDWFPKTINKYEKITTGIHSQDYYLEDHQKTGDTVSIISNVLDYNRPDIYFDEKIICNLNIHELKDFLENIKIRKIGFLVLLDNTDNFLLSGNPKFSDSAFLEKLKKNYLKNENKEIFNIDANNIAILKESKLSGWKVFAVIPEKAIYENWQILKLSLIVIVIFLVCIILFSSHILNKIIFLPLTNIVYKMEKIEKGDFSVSWSENSSIEIDFLSCRIEKMINEINNLNKKIYSTELDKKEAQIKTLESQINPHFLFNTMQSIKTMAYLEESPETGNMITLLSRVLQYGLYNIGDLVPIRSEINNIVEYVNIQKYRYPDKIILNIEYTEKIKKYFSQKLILQPLVENAIKHALPYNSKINILLKITENETGILCSILDNGYGIEKDRLEIIQNNIANIVDSKSSIGLLNVHKRIFLKYDYPYGIYIDSVYKEWTEVTVLIPKIIKEDVSDNEIIIG